MRVSVFVLLIIAVGLCSMSAMAAELLLNPGFETWSGTTVADNWTLYGPFTAGSKGTGMGIIPHGGSECQRIRLYPNPAQQCSGGVFQRFTTVSGYTYNASAWFLTDGDEGSAVRLGLDPENGSTAPSASTKWSGYLQGITEWTQLTKSATATSTQMTIWLEGYHGQIDMNKRNMYFDDASVPFVPEPSGFIALLSGFPIALFAIRRRK